MAFFIDNLSYQTNTGVVCATLYWTVKDLNWPALFLLLTTNWFLEQTEPELPYYYNLTEWISSYCQNVRFLQFQHPCNKDIWNLLTACYQSCLSLSLLLETF